MSGREVQYELPKNIERYLAVLSKLYGRESKRQQQEIIVNAQPRVHEAWSYDNWNGGTFGHALYLTVPEALFLSIARQREELQKQIKEDINKIHNVRSEFIEEVFLEMGATEDQNWRRESGLLISATPVVAPDAERRIWGDEGFRIFLSHKSEVKKRASELKGQLKDLGVAGFVAHEDIRPTREWQSEIENALYSMDVLVSLMTEKFHESDWTDQELGFAFGRGVPVICVRLGRDPYGFIGKFQALSCTWDAAPKEIVKLLVKHERMLESYIRSVGSCYSFDHGNVLSEILPSIEKLSDEQAEKLVAAFNNNEEVRFSFGFSGIKPNSYGLGLAHHLNRLTGRMYKVLSSGKIKVQS